MVPSQAGVRAGCSAFQRADDRRKYGVGDQRRRGGRPIAGRRWTEEHVGLDAKHDDAEHEHRRATRRLPEVEPHRTKQQQRFEAVIPGTMRTFSMPRSTKGAQRTSSSWTAMNRTQSGIAGSAFFAAKLTP